MELTLDQYLDRIAARVVDNKQKIERELLQRRDQITDIDGIEYTRNGAPGVPATFYLDISTDMIYLSRFGFKLLLTQYTQLSPTEDPIVVPIASSGFRVLVDGVDVSYYLAAQYDGWIGGAGVYPSNKASEIYDLLEASCDMRAKGDKDLAEKIVTPGFKRIDVVGTSMFTAILRPYCTFSHVSR